MWLSILVASLLPSCYYGSTDYPTGAPTSSNPTGAPTLLTYKPTFVPSFTPTTPTSYCIEFVLLDKFGDGWDTAHFYLFDSYNIYRKYAPTCIDNRVYTEYCFDTSTNKDGDYLTAMADGYKPDQPWEIFWQAFDVSSGTIYTGAYQTKMVFTFHKAGPASYISLSSSDFLQPNTVDHCESCIFENKDGAAQWWYSPTRTPTLQPTPLAFHPTPSPSISLNPSYTHQPSTDPTNLPVAAPATHSNDASSNKNFIMEPQLSYRNTYNHGNKSPLRNNGHRNLRIFYYDDDIELGMAGHNGSNWFSNDNLGAVYTISNATGDILYYSGTMCTGQKYPPIETTTITANRKLSTTRNLLDKPSPLIPSDLNGQGEEGSNEGGAGAGAVGSSQYTRESCDWEDLEPGYYRIRVTGSNYDYKSEVLWSLCGLLGHAQEELLFQIADDENKEYRECITYYLRNSTEFCGEGGIAGVSDYVTLQATIHLGGISVTELSTSQINVIKTTLAQEFSDISALVIPQSDIQILSWKSSSSSGSGSNTVEQLETQSHSEVELVKKHRQLLTATVTTSAQAFNEITFSARLPTHTTTTKKIMDEVNPSKRYETKHLKSYLQSAMSSGLFLSHLKSHTLNFKETEFHKITTAELLNIDIINETNYNSKVSQLLNVIVYGGTLIGVTFSVLLVKWYYVSTVKNSYNLVSENSMHSVVSKE